METRESPAIQLGYRVQCGGQQVVTWWKWGSVRESAKGRRSHAEALGRIPKKELGEKKTQAFLKLGLRKVGGLNCLATAP